MAKKKATNQAADQDQATATEVIDSLTGDQASGTTVEPEPPQVSDQADQAAQPPQVSERQMRFPWDESVPAIDFGLHLDMRLTCDQATALKRIAAGLDQEQATLANGRRVTNSHYSGAIKWILEAAIEHRPRLP